ncbi:MAG: hypothetical protein U0R64_01365 [Candidatus Nanopelagicales bacterium]
MTFPAPVHALTGVLVALGMTLLAACGSTPAPTDPATNSIATGRAPDTPFDLTAGNIGIHSFSTQPQVPAGAIRLSCYPGWSQVNPNRNDYDWATFDRLVTQAEDWGFSDILFVFCSTPHWAGEPLTSPDEAVFGPGSAQAPADMQDFANFVSAVVERYRGRISGYEVWNEPANPQFFTGTPEQMATMTQIVKDAVDDLDPGAYVLSAGVQTHSASLVSPFVPRYLAALRARGWPVDGISAHFYPGDPGTPQTRLRQIRQIQGELDSAGAPPDLPLWDTEVNYDLGRAGGAPDGRIHGRQAAAWVTQTYLDSWRAGIRRTYWYTWTEDYYSLLGIQMRPGDAATTALQLLGSWVVSTHFNGCRERDGVVDCSFTRPDGPSFRIAWVPTGSGRVPVAPGASVCPVDGSACTTTTGSSLRVSELPVRIE